MHVRPVPCDAHTTTADNAPLPVALSTFAQTFEMAVSQFAKTTYMVVVLHTVLDVLADEEAKDFDGKELDKKSYWRTAMTSAQRAERQLAITPDMMDAILKSLAFTNNADVAMVQMIYRKTYEAVVTKARSLAFPSMHWITKEQWGQFLSRVLSQCTHLEELFLEFNPTLEEDIVELVGKLPPTLKKLYLTWQRLYHQSRRFHRQNGGYIAGCTSSGATSARPRIGLVHFQRGVSLARISDSRCSAGRI